MEIFERKVVKINETSKRMSRLIPFSCLILIFLLTIRTKTVHMGSSFLTWIGFEVFYLLHHNLDGMATYLGDNERGCHGTRGDAILCPCRTDLLAIRRVE